MSAAESPEFNPILVQFMRRIPEVPPHGVLVAKRKRDGVFVSLGSGRLSVGESIFGLYEGFAVVDKRSHSMSFVAKLPSVSDSYRFIAEIDLHVRAVDPVKVLCSGVTGTRMLLQSKVEKCLRGLTASKAIEERDRVEKDCQRALATFALDDGLEVSEVVIRIELDENARKILASRQRLKDEDEERVRRIRIEDEERVRRIRIEDEERRRKDAELRRQTTENEQDLKAGTQRLVAKLLAIHPEALPEIIKEFRALEHLEASSRYELFKKISEHPKMEGIDFLDDFRNYVREFLDQASMRLPTQRTVRAGLTASTRRTAEVDGNIDKEGPP